MGIRQKFFLLAGLIGIIVAIVSCMGYYTAYTNLEASVEQEISAAVDTQGARMDGWLRQKAVPALSAASLMTELDGQESLSNMHDMMSLAASDKAHHVPLERHGKGRIHELDRWRSHGKN